MKWIKLRIELKPSCIDKGGVGVFAVSEIKKGLIVAEGLRISDFKHLVSWEKFKKLDDAIKEKVMAFCVGTPEGFVPPEDKNFNNLSVEWFFNHSCVGNLGFDKHGDFVAISDIQIGEEITYDYGLVETNPNFNMRCKCKDKACRKVITGDDWKQLINDKSKRKYMHPFVKLGAAQRGSA
jgi:SET domain-containing protein